MKTLFGIVVLFLLSFAVPLYASCGEIHEFAADKLVSVETSFSHSQNETANFITTIGTLKNTSDFIAEDIIVEVKYFDAQKKLIDVVTQPLYGIVVPPLQEVAIRVRDEADKPKEAYFSNTLRVVSAQQGGVRQPQQKKTASIWIGLLSSWGPMLLLIVVWVFFIRKAYRKGSPQLRLVELMEQQNAVFIRQLEILERLAVAAEKSMPE